MRMHEYKILIFNIFDIKYDIYLKLCQKLRILLLLLLLLLIIIIIISATIINKNFEFSKIIEIIINKLSKFIKLFYFLLFLNININLNIFKTYLLSTNNNNINTICNNNSNNTNNNDFYI